MKIVAYDMIHRPQETVWRSAGKTNRKPRPMTGLCRRLNTASDPTLTLIRYEIPIPGRRSIRVANLDTCRITRPLGVHVYICTATIHTPFCKYLEDDSLRTI